MATLHETLSAENDDDGLEWFAGSMDTYRRQAENRRKARLGIPFGQPVNRQYGMNATNRANRIARRVGAKQQRMNKRLSRIQEQRQNRQRRLADQHAAYRNRHSQ